MSFFQPSPSDIARFRDDGFLVVEGLLNPAETRLLGEIARADQALAKSASGRQDAAGAIVTLAVRNDLSNDMYSAIAASRRIVEGMSAFLGSEIYHYHHKLILKEPRVGGAWEWHQDYGYWYHNGCLSPDMGSCLLAIDRATVANGCLQVLRRSHRLGRIDHGKTGDQAGADLERVEVALTRFERLPVELEPGSAIFFHANLLHRSDQNRSDDPRWALICCYNTRHNDPYKPGRHPGYSPLAILEDEQVEQVASQHWARLQADATLR